MAEAKCPMCGAGGSVGDNCEGCGVAMEETCSGCGNVKSGCQCGEVRRS